MSKFKKTAIIILAVAAIFIIIIYLIISGRHTTANNKYPSAIMDDMQSATYNAQGELTRHLRAKQMLHYDTNNSSAFVQPKMQLATSGGQTWFISANKGLSLNQDNEIE